MSVVQNNHQIFVELVASVHLKFCTFFYYRWNFTDNAWLSQKKGYLFGSDTDNRHYALCELVDDDDNIDKNKKMQTNEKSERKNSSDTEYGRAHSYSHGNGFDKTDWPTNTFEWTNLISTRPLLM